MKTISTNILRLAALLMLVAALSGCAQGGRVRTTPTLRLSQTAAAATATPIGQQTTPTLSSKPVTADPTARSVSPTPTADTQGGDLLKMIGTLDASNQTGDPLDNLP